MGLPWIELHTSLPRHSKSIRLALLLQDERAWAYVAQLWLWCADSCQSGQITGTVATQVVECAAGWKGEPGKLAAAMLEVGFLDQLENGLEAHGWPERAKAHIAKLERDADRQRKRYERISAKFKESKKTSRGETAENARRNNGEGAENDRISRGFSEASRRDSHRNSNPNPNPNPSSSKKEKPPPDPFLDPSGAFFDWFQSRRESAGFVREKPPPISTLSSSYSEAMLELNGDEERLKQAAYAFGDDPFWQAKNLPFAGLMSQVQKYAPRKLTTTG